jgi:hypothetical protein
MSTTLTYSNDSQVLNLSLYNARKIVHDAVFNKMVLLWWAMQSGKKKYYSGGKGFREHVLVKENTDGGAFDRGDVTAITAQQPTEEAFYPWRKYNKPITIFDTDEMENAGPTQLASLFDVLTRQARMSLKKDINTDLYGLPTDKTLWGLPKAIPLTGYDSGDYAGISRSDYEGWRPQVQSAVGSYYVTSTTTFAMRDAMLDCFNDCSNFGEGQPGLFLTSQTAFQYYDSGLFGYVRIVDEKFVNSKFPGIKFGPATVTYDPNFENQSSSGQDMYVLTADDLTLAVHRKRDFAITPFESLVPAGQIGRRAYILVYLNLIFTTLRTHGLIPGITART